MKTKLTILGLVMAISFLFTQSLAATEVRVIETSGTCSGSNACFGKIKLALEVSAGPLKVVLLQGNAIKSSKSFAKGNFEHVFENLCVGTYEVKYYPEQFPVCYKLIENIQVKDEETFSVNILDWIDNDHVKIATTKSGNYEYYWSSDNQSYTKGTDVSPSFPSTQRFIYVKVVDLNTGCTVIRTIQQLCDFQSPGYFLDVYAKIEWESTSDPNKVKVIAKVSRNTGGYQSPSPDVYAITWTGKNNTILGYGSELVLEKSNPNLASFEFGKLIKLTIEYSCNKSEALAVIDCANLSSEFLTNYLVSENKPYCEGIANSAWVVFKLDEIKTKINSSVRIAMGLNINQSTFVSTEVNKLSLRQNGASPVYREGTELRYTPGHYFFFSSDGSYRIDFELLGCKYAFDVNISKVKPTYAFKSFNNGKCIYERKCSGKTETLSFDAIRGPFVQNGSDCGAIELFCNYLDGMNRKVGEDDIQYKKTPAFLYQYILWGEYEKAMGNGNSTLAEKFRADAEDAAGLYHCHDVKYCPITFRKISIDNPRIDLLSFTKGPTCDDGCWIKQCAGVTLNACSVSSYREPEGNCCSTNRVERSLLDMLNAYEGLVQDNRIDEFYLSQPSFQGSEVEQILLDHANSSDPRINCATIVFCPIGFKLMNYEDPSLNPLHPLDHVQCNQEIMAPPVEIAENDNQNGSGIQDKDDEVKKRKTVLCLTCLFHRDHKPGKFPRRRSTIACPSWKIKKRKHRGVAIGRNIAELINPSITALQSNEQSYDAFAELTTLLSNTGEMEEILKVHAYVDTTNEQKLSRFSTILSQGETSPKLLFTIDSVQHYYNYSHQLEDLDHFKQPDIEHLIEDWDEWRDYYVRSSVAHKEYLIAAQDTNSVWALPLVSDSLVSVEHFSSYDSLLYVAGYYKGLLYLGGQAIDSLADHNQIGLFFMQLSKNGQVLNISLAENIDTTGGLAFSENKAGVVQVAAHAQQDSLKLNTQVQVLPQAGAVVLLQYSDSNGLQFLNAVGNSSQTTIGGVTLSTGGTASTLALFGGGYAQIQNAFPSLNIGDSLTLLSFANNGNFVKARNSNAAHLIPSKFALSYGAGEGLLLGVTYNQTTTLFGDTLSNEGLEDVAIMKYAAVDTLEWGELYGTADNESVSKMMYDAQGIAYFAGEFAGSQEARMIGNYIFTDTTGLPTQRVYLSYVIDTLPSVQNTTTELTAIEHPVAISKTPTIADMVQSLGVFPNPFTNQTTVICTTTEAGQYTLVVQNELGKVVSQQSLELGLGQNSQVLSTQQFTPGFYYLTLRNAKGKVVGAQKLIKQ